MRLFLLYFGLVLALPFCAIGAAAKTAPICKDDSFYASTTTDGDEEPEAEAAKVTLRATVCFGLGDESWADSLVTFAGGSPIQCSATEQEDNAVGAPDNKRTLLGQGGSIVLKFESPGISDFSGPDLWIFERGGWKEPVNVELLDEKGQWVQVGDTKGGLSAIDLSKVREAKGRSFQSMRLTDIGTRGPDADCKPNFDGGADIDAVGAKVCAISFSPESFAFFAVDQASLSPDAERTLLPVLALLANTRGVRVFVHGFADADGTEEHNMDLSGRRAEAVKSYLQAKLPRAVSEKLEIDAVPHGETGATSESDETKRGNRRVEVRVLPVGGDACSEVFGD